MAKSITVIPQTRNLFTTAPIATAVRRRVAGYARVSTDSDEQFTSYEAQIDYYTNFIKSKPEWDFVRVYTDMKTPSLIQFNDLRRLAGRGVSLRAKEGKF